MLLGRKRDACVVKRFKLAVFGIFCLTTLTVRAGAGRTTSWRVGQLHELTSCHFCLTASRRAAALGRTQIAGPQVYVYT